MRKRQLRYGVLVSGGTREVNTLETALGFISGVLLCFTLTRNSMKSAFLQRIQSKVIRINVPNRDYPSACGGVTLRTGEPSECAW